MAGALGAVDLSYGAVASTPTFSGTTLVQSSQFGGTGGTGAAINTTGYNLIVIVLTYNALVGPNISDSKGNTWTALTAQSNIGMGALIYYCANPTVGTVHTFSTTSHFSGVNVLCLKSSGSTPNYNSQQSGNAANASGNIQPGSITPSVANCCMVTGFGSFNGAPAPSMPTGYTQIGAYTTSTAEAGGAGYQIQTTATATNPTWNSNGSSQAVVLAAFHP